MKKIIILILGTFVICVTGTVCAEDAMRGEVMLPSPPNVASEDSPLDYGPPAYLIPANTMLQSQSTLPPREWYIVEKIPTGKGLGIGVFLFQEGMPIDHIQSVFGKPQEMITLEMEDGSLGTILVYRRHHFFFSKTGSLQTIKERKL